MAEKPTTIEKTDERAYTRSRGRRKEATSQVRLFPNGGGSITVNDKEYKTYFPTPLLQQIVVSPLTLVGGEERFSFTIKIRGGGVRGQAESARLGIARALIAFNPDYRATLKKAGFLTRDARVRERKKYGKKSARRSPQWAKR